MAALTTREVLDKIGGQPAIRNYLRGIEAGSETDEDALRSMLAAIAAVRAGGVYDCMADLEPELYAQACLLLCRQWTDAEDAAAVNITMQFSSVILLLRTDRRNIKS